MLPILLHGDAAFAGQGVVWECLSFSGLPGYGTGGTIHFIINNQVGFTTSPQFGRSSPYPSDVAKGVQAPILHVNGDDPEAVTFCCKLATEFRQTFSRDIVIDMWCYRRFGHNEGDEPSFTQPLMYAAIKKHPPISQIYGQQLMDEGVVDQAWIDQQTKDYIAHLEEEFQAARFPTCPTRRTGSKAAGRGSAVPTSRCSGGATSRPRSARTSCSASAQVLTTVPDGLHDPQDAAAHPRRQEGDVRRAARASTGRPPKRSPSAASSPKGMASACPARTAAAARSASAMRSGSISRPARNIFRCATSKAAASRCATARCRSSACSASNMAIRSPTRRRLVLWEAQFGDFANGAQSIIDQFIAAGEAKWLRASGLVMLLPHGFEGQGPEHSSARLERYLQLCAEDNLQVANCTTPANYFHILGGRCAAISASR